MSSEATTVNATGSLVAREALIERRSSGLRGLMRSRSAAGLASFALSFMVLASLLLVSVASAHVTFLSPPSRAEFPTWMSGPLGNLTSWFTPSRNSLKVGFTLAVGAMYLCYLVVLLCAPRLRARWVIGAVVLLHVIFFLSPPLSLTDVFNYINYGRMEIVHGLNPYTTIPLLEPHNDPTFLLSNWHHLLSPYGPLFTIFTFALVPLGVATSFWVLKAILLLASLATLRLVWRSAELLGRDPLRATLFVGLNPVVLVWGLGGDHNDFLMIFFLMLAVYLLLRARSLRSGLRPATPATGVAAPTRPQRVLAAFDGAPRPVPAGESGPSREVLAGVALVAAVAIKASAGILLPVVLLGAARRLRLLGGMAIGAIIFGAGSIAAFGTNLPNLGEQSQLVTAVGLPNLLGNALGSGGETDTLMHVLSAVLVVAVVLCAVWAWRSHRWITASGFATLALLFTLSWTLPWYVFWLLPLAALSRSRTLRVAAIGLGIYLMLAWVPLMTDIIHSVGFKPSTTTLGQLHQARTQRLLH
ncbi:MAG: hypothetical protein ACR2ND_15800 [Solirubrobacteraceae bacterium]